MSKIIDINKFIKEFKKIKIDSDIDLIRNGSNTSNIEHKYPKIIKLKDVKRKNNIYEEYINKYILQKKNYESNNLLSEKIKYEYYQRLTWTLDEADNVDRT